MHSIAFTGLVGFIQDVYTVREDKGFVSLPLFLFNSSVDVEVNFTTFEQTAIKGILMNKFNNRIIISLRVAVTYLAISLLGKDYKQISEQISITGNQTNVTINIPIMNDFLAEGLETIGGRLEIISPTNISSASTITIEIIDDEGIIMAMILNYLSAYRALKIYSQCICRYWHLW